MSVCGVVCLWQGSRPPLPSLASGVVVTPSHHAGHPRRALPHVGQPRSRRQGIYLPSRRSEVKRESSSCNHPSDRPPSSFPMATTPPTDASSNPFAVPASKTDDPMGQPVPESSGALPPGLGMSWPSPQCSRSCRHARGSGCGRMPRRGAKACARAALLLRHFVAPRSGLARSV